MSGSLFCDFVGSFLANSLIFVLAFFSEGSQLLHKVISPHVGLLVPRHRLSFMILFIIDEGTMLTIKYLYKMCNGVTIWRLKAYFLLIYRLLVEYKYFNLP